MFCKLLSGKTGSIAVLPVFLCIKIARKLHLAFIVLVLLLCENLSMKKEFTKVIPVKETETLRWVKTKEHGIIIFKAESKDVYKNESKSVTKSCR